MDDRYFFDKRIIKQKVKKYGLIFLCLFPILILINTLLKPHLTFWLIVLIDASVAFLGLLVVELIINHIKDKKEEKQDFVVIKAKEIKAKRNKNSEDK